jgi:hypothetical protein
VPFLFTRCIFHRIFGFPLSALARSHDLIEQLGRGFRRNLEETERQKLPEPKIEEIGLKSALPSIWQNPRY